MRSSDLNRPDGDEQFLLWAKRFAPLCQEFHLAALVTHVANRRRRSDTTTTMRKYSANIRKCDQVQPVCSRCARLQIPCIGCGQRRFKFKDQAVILNANKNPPHQQQISIISRVSTSPSNETTILAGAFISALEVSDLRYDLSCYGNFLKGIPKRLGKNIALDASVSAITHAFPSIYTGQRSPEALARYGDALKALRICLDDPINGRTVETVCAIWLIMICQVSKMCYILH
jgi:hypothetical protein